MCPRHSPKFSFSASAEVSPLHSSSQSESHQKIVSLRPGVVSCGVSLLCGLGPVMCWKAQLVVAGGRAQALSFPRRTWRGRSPKQVSVPTGEFWASGASSMPLSGPCSALQTLRGPGGSQPCSTALRSRPSFPRAAWSCALLSGCLTLLLRSSQNPCQPPRGLQTASQGGSQAPRRALPAPGSAHALNVDGNTSQQTRPR